MSNKILDDMSVQELEELKESTHQELESATIYMQGLSDSLREIKQAIYEKTPRDLSIVEVERMLGFKVNIVEKDKMRILY